MLLSGGVDSSVAMRLLLDQGYKIRAFYLKIWLEDELAHLNECPWEEDLAYATAVCEQAGVPLEVVPLQREYWDQVVSYTVREAREGRTPNPDVMCNSRIKFGMFYDHVGKHFRHVATGHYARLEHSGGSDDANATPSDRSAAAAAAAAGTEEPPVRVAAGSDRGRVRLLLSPDAVKDQTYFLCALTQDQLRKALFPLGVYTKDQIRELAESYDLPTKHRKDSQGICFLGKLKFDEFLQHYLGTSPGAIVDQTGRHIGEHKGLWFHTIGQRKGVGPGLVPGVVNLGPWYVADKDMERNVLVVTNDREAIASPREVFRVEALQWISGRPPAELARDRSMRLRVKTRHGPQMRDCLLRLVPEVAPGDSGGRAGGAEATVEDRVGSPTRGYVNLDSKDSALAPGQFAAFYLGGECVGSGVMCGWSAAAAAAVGVVAGGEGGIAAGLESEGGLALRRLEEERGGVLERRGTASAAAPAAAIRQ
ncbi:tRNA-methyltransferase [Ectocarpus siliculosus]|uniref:tRNA-5-taurinomethyluridine 2-sulfurtransferase n=1 Tax=Ectocarpus siliculosus TaxID=2880 RepID=D8LCG7_ECTSI|nr:tRNA-methyltransferase [Ectocarpus siliculosus]|eukprot:CBN78203.1 tRNA-methyltransferase [Ectocarpus siliculosus]